MNDKFIYFENFFEIKNNIIIFINKNVTKRELLKIFEQSLSFPIYFGNNWDALYDCLIDLNWIEEKGIIIIHQDLPLEGLERKIYLDLLSDVVLYWDKHPEIKINVCFSNKCKNEINDEFFE